MSASEDQWLIQGDGGAVAEYTSFLGFEYNSESAIPEKAVEEGSFFSANKWDYPYDIIVEIGKMGDVNELSSFLDALETWRNSTELVSLVTPAKTYTNGNIYGVGYSWNGEEHGPRMIIAKVAIKEVRLVGESAAANSGGGISGAGNSEHNSTKNRGMCQGTGVASL